MTLLINDTHSSVAAQKQKTKKYRVFKMELPLFESRARLIYKGLKKEIIEQHTDKKKTNSELISFK